MGKYTIALLHVSRVGDALFFNMFIHDLFSSGMWYNRPTPSNINSFKIYMWANKIPVPEVTSLRNGIWLNMTIISLHPCYTTRFGKGIWANGSPGWEPGTKVYVSLDILRNCYFYCPGLGETW